MEGHLLDVFSGELFHDMKQVEYIHIYIYSSHRVVLLMICSSVLALAKMRFLYIWGYKKHSQIRT